METEDEYVEVTIISNTELPPVKMSPGTIARIEQKLKSLHEDPEDDFYDSDDGSEGAKQAHQLEFKDCQDTAGILNVARLQTGKIATDMPKIRLSKEEQAAVAEFQIWMKSESVGTKMGGSSIVHLQRVAGSKPSYLAATDDLEGDSKLLLTNGQKTKILDVQTVRQVVPWGKHIYVRTDEANEIIVYDLKLQEKYRFKHGANQRLRILARKEFLAFSYHDWDTGLKHPVIIDRNVQWPPKASKDNGQCDKDIDSDPDPHSCNEDSDKPLFGRKVMPEESEFWEDGESPFMGETAVCCFSICPFTKKIVFINWDQSQQTHYIQKGGQITRLPHETELELEFESPDSSYSGNWYITCYPQPEPQEKTIYLVDQKTLELKGSYFFESPGHESSLHFLKPHRELYPVLMNSSYQFPLFCEYKDILHPITTFKWPHSLPCAEHFFVTHLRDRVWLCLDTFNNPQILVIDTPKLYDLLQLS